MKSILLLTCLVVAGNANEKQHSKKSSYQSCIDASKKSHLHKRAYQKTKSKNRILNQCKKKDTFYMAELEEKR